MTAKAIGEDRPTLPEIQRYELFHWGEINPLRARRSSPLFNDRALWFAYGRQALKVGLQSLGISPGDKVLVPDYICNVIESAFAALNITISYYNVREDTTPNFEDAAKKIDKKTKAFLAVNYYGLPAPIETIKAFCNAHRLFFIEDNAQGFLNELNGQSLGTFGDIGFTSVRKSLPIMHGAFLFIHPNIQRSLPSPSKQEFTVSKSSTKFIIYYIIKAILNSKFPPFLQIKRHKRQKIKSLWGNAPQVMPDKCLKIRLNPFVPLILNLLNYNKICDNKRKKYEGVMAFLGEQSLFPGKIFIKNGPSGTIPFQVPFLLANQERKKDELLTYLNQNGVEAFYWPDLPQAVVGDPYLYPVANYLKNNLIHFPI